MVAAEWVRTSKTFSNLAPKQRGSVTGVLVLLLILVTSFTVGPTGSASAEPPASTHGNRAPAPSPGPSVPDELKGHRHARACPPPQAKQVSCSLILDLDVSGALASPTTAPSGYAPADLQTAYSLPSATGGVGHTIAIVDAYDAPTAASDLGVYRSQFGLPDCGTGCFTKVNQSGGSTMPPFNAGWATEISLDLDMVSAACPNCHILLVEANTSSLQDMGTAVATAVRMGATAVSNSYGVTEFSGESAFDVYYNHPGVTITASSGDSSYGVRYPAASPYVTAVGGTRLTRDSTSGSWQETAWAGSGSGCSAFESKPTWQHDAGCSARTVADVAAVADPGTGVALYNSTPDNGISGWLVAGGTSVSAPLIAAASALGPEQSSTVYPVQQAYAATSGLTDIVSGSNGTCAPTYLCTAGAGYDGPTGVGSPFGTAALAPGTLSGTVSTSTVPVGAGDVSVRYSRKDESGNWGAEVEAGVTDASGKYSIPSFPPGYYRLHFVWLGSAPIQSRYWGGDIFGPTAGGVQVLSGATIDASLPTKQNASGHVNLGTPPGDRLRVSYSYDANESPAEAGHARNAPQWTPVPGVSAVVGAGGAFALPNLADAFSYRFTISDLDDPSVSATVERYTNGVTQIDSTGPHDISIELSGTVSFLRALYHDFLNREPGQSEIAGWGSALQAGLPRGQVAGGFVNSDEYRLIRIDAAYQDILKRPAESGGRMSWLNGMKRGVLTTDDIERALYASDEFFAQQGGTNGDFVKALYVDVLHRPAVASEWQGWAAQIDAGTLSRTDLISIFWRSLETARERVSLMFTKYFGRAASESDRVFWGDYVLKYGDSAVRSALTGSDEYFAHASQQYN